MSWQPFPLCCLESCSFTNKLFYTLCFFRAYSGYFFAFINAWHSSRTSLAAFCRKASHSLLSAHHRTKRWGWHCHFHLCTKIPSLVSGHTTFHPSYQRHHWPPSCSSALKIPTSGLWSLALAPSFGSPVVSWSFGPRSPLHFPSHGHTLNLTQN